MTELIITEIDGYKVLPCPFCKKSEVYVSVSVSGWKFVRCINCGADGPVDLGVSGAVEAWNTRCVKDDEQ